MDKLQARRGWGFSSNVVSQAFRLWILHLVPADLLSRPTCWLSSCFYFGAEHEKFAPSSVLPVPLYVATCG